MPASDVNVGNSGFIQQPQNTLKSGIKRWVLLAIAFEYNNNTNISCRVYASMNTDSNIAVLRIQGKLMLQMSYYYDILM